MKRILLAPLAALLSAASFGCGGSLAHPDTTLDRVVVYRNGVAYFERSAHLTGEQLTVRVRSGDVDDFLKSLSVVDAATRASIPVEYPGRDSQGAYGAVDMKIRLPAPGPHDVRLSYVAEAPAWKPTYRATLGDKGKLSLEGLAIVDNASDEDWSDVRLAVAASAALSFRFDLKTLRVMQREQLAASPLLAPAPPPGGVPYGGEAAAPKSRFVIEVPAETLDAVGTKEARLEAARMLIPRMEATRAKIAKMLTIARDQRDVVKTLCENDKLVQTDGFLAVAKQRLAAMEAAQGDEAVVSHEAAAIQAVKKRIEQLEAESNQCVGEEAAFLGEAAVTTTIDPGIAADDEGQATRGSGRAAIDLTPGSARGSSPPPPAPPPGPPPPPRPTELRKPPTDPSLSTEPVGSGHFEAPQRATIASGASAMVSVFRAEASGDLVYVYDRESAHGSDAYAFLALRFRNPTSEALEGGPFTVFGEGRLMGEGIADSIPAAGLALVPFAMDRQIAVTRKESEGDEITRIAAVSAGKLLAEVAHLRTSTLVLRSRRAEATTVYVRHTVAKGRSLRKAPADRDKLGAAELFRVEVPAGREVEVVIEESAPSEKSIDPLTKEGAELVRAFIASPGADAWMREALGGLLAAAAALDAIDEHIVATRADADACKERRAEIEGQIASLRGAGASSKPLLARLTKKLSETNERLAGAAAELLSLEEKRLEARQARDAALRRAGAPAKGGSARGVAAASLPL